MLSTATYSSFGRHQRLFYGMVSNLKDCELCHGNSPSSSLSLWRTIFDFLWLYLIGMTELFRQWLVVALQKPGNASKEKSALHELRSANPIILLTGCTSGIGRQILAVLLDNNIQVIAFTHRAETILSNECEHIHMDLSSRRSVETASAAVVQSLKQIAVQRTVVLIHCAGVYYPRPDSPSEGMLPLLTECLNVNVINPFAFVERISPAIDGIVWIGSSSQRVAPRLGNAHCLLHAARTPFAMYPLSKLLALLIAEKWSSEKKKPAAVIHPGIVNTDLYRGERGIIGFCIRLLIPFVAWDVKKSVSRILQLINASAFWERATQQSIPTFPRPGHNGVYWDAVSMMLYPLPPQIRNDGDRTALATRLYAALENC